MASFIYIATNAKGDSVTGTIEASDRASVMEILNRQNLKPLSVKEEAANKLSFELGDFMGGGKIKTEHLVMFTRQLSAMVSAGVPLLRALSSLESHSESPALKKILQSINRDVQSGAPLADALAKYPNTFNDIYVNMVRAGEAAGILDDILKRLALQQEKAASIRKKVKSAMTYPIVLMVITVGAFFGLMLFVIPTIGNIVKDLGGPDAELPLITQIMLGISAFMVNFWYLLLPGLIGGIVFLIRYIKTPVGKKQFHRILLKLPGIKLIVTKLAVARFARTFSALMGAGVPIIESLNVTARAVGNVLYEESLIDASEQIKSGANLSSVIEKNQLFPAIVAQMLAVGEETGQIDTVLIKVADFYEEEVDAAIDGISSIIEPVMILVMGTVVGLVAASVMSPIAGMANQIQE